MNADYFLDTNIIAYAFDQDSPEKQVKALELIDDQAPWQVSWQIIQEFSNVALYRFKAPMSTDALSVFSELVLWPHCRVLPTPSIHSRALEIHSQSQYRFYDSLIVAAALEAGVSTLYSEDLQHGRQFGPLTIRNPFVQEN